MIPTRMAPLSFLMRLPRQLFVVLVLEQALRTAAVPNNYTIDDQFGDSSTGALPTYSPENVWTEGNQCTTCFAQPFYQLAFDHTWHDGTIHPGDPEPNLSVTMSFFGTAIYAYCILDNSITYTTFTNLTFSIDGALVGTFSYTPDGSNTFIYDYLVYANTSIPNGNHTFVLTAPQGANASLVLFDYVAYTYDASAANPSAILTSTQTALPQRTTASSPTRTTSKASVIAGGTIGGVAVFLLIFIAIFALCRRQRRGSDGKIPQATIPPLDEPVETAPSTSTWTPLHIPSTSQTSRYDPYSDTSYPNSSLSQLQDVAPVGHPMTQASHSSYLETMAVDPALRESSRRRQISRRLQDRKQTLAMLERRRSGALSPSASSDTALESQMEDLRHEVARLREMLADRNLEAPPGYND